jgi:transcription termination factor Rho
MANETRPRRETSGTSRLRKSSTPAPAPASNEATGSVPPAPPTPPYPGAAEPPPATVEPTFRDRPSREPYREEGPADREPIRYIRERPERESARERPEREPGISIRERLARDRAERDSGPAHHEGIPVARDRDREPGPVIRDRRGDLESPTNHRDRFDRDSSFNSRDRDYSPPPRL